MFFRILEICTAVQVTGAVHFVLAVRRWLYVSSLMLKLSVWSFYSASGRCVCLPLAYCWLRFFFELIAQPKWHIISLILRSSLLFCCAFEALFWLRGVGKLCICWRILCLVLCCLILYIYLNFFFQLMSVAQLKSSLL